MLNPHVYGYYPQYKKKDKQKDKDDKNINLNDLYKKNV